MPKSHERFCNKCQQFKEVIEFELKIYGGTRKKYCIKCTRKTPPYYGKKFPNKKNKESFYLDQVAKYNKGKHKDAQI